MYKDDFAADADVYKKASGEYDENGGRLVANPETSGRFHSDWCSMIYPRLLLARDFLTPDGAIFISIDDNEQANLKKICDEVFGASNFIAQLVWQRAYSPKNDARFVSNSHDYVLMYSRDISKFTIGCLPRTEEANSRYQNPDNDPRSPWMSSDISEKTYDPNNDYPTQRPRGESWSLQDGRIWFGPDGDNTPRIKRFLSELKFDGMAPQSILPYSEVGHSQEGSQETSKLMGGGYFDGPKPVRLLQRILRLGNAKDDSLIRDFFSGSATTAHAVMKTNAEDGGNRRFSSPTYTITRGTQQDTMSKSDVDAGSAMHIIAKSARKSLDVTPPPVTNVTYDLLGEIAEACAVTRRCAAEILSGIWPDKFAMFRTNPEQFIAKVGAIVRQQKASQLVESIVYHTTEGTYDPSIFMTDGNNNRPKADAAPTRKCVQHWIFPDGDVEHKFTDSLENGEEVDVYAKLPRGFQIPTPVGNYAPDWAIVLKDPKSSSRHLFFVVETKSSMETMDLRGVENSKIECAKRLYNSLKFDGDNVHYEKVANYTDLLNAMDTCAQPAD